MKKLAGALKQGQHCQRMINYHLKKLTTKSPSQTKRYGVIKLAQDVHAHFVVSCIQEEGQPPKAPRKRDLRSHLEWVKQLVAQSQKVYSCYEAGPTGFSLHRQLSQLGVQNVVVVPSHLDEQGRRVNNDKTDTLHLAARLDRYVAGNQKSFTVVRVPTEEQEQRRVWPRQRKQLQQQRLSVASQGRSLVLTQGVAIDNLWWQEGRWKVHQSTLAPWLVAHLEVFRRIILVVNQEIEQLDKKIVAAQSVSPKPSYAGAASLAVVQAEVCDWERFKSWRKAGSYCGLCGGVSASGQFHRDLNITKRGNRRLRTVLVEMAWRMVRYQPDYWLSKKWAAVLKDKTHRRNRKRAIVAYARQLFIDLWKWKTGRITAQQLGWQMS